MSFSTKISACEKGQQWEHAFAAVMSFNSTISGYEKQWQWEHAFAVVRASTWHSRRARSPSSGRLQWQT
eukprot:2686641-Karenia_brevis.AAC.1